MRLNMRTRIALTGLVGITLTVVGCSPAPPERSAQPTKSARAPAFATPDEAFEAAVAVYARYVELWNLIASEGGAGSERLLEVVADNPFAEEEMQVFSDFAASGVKIEGGVTFSRARLVQYKADTDAIQIYACSDISRARVIDSQGTDVTPERDELIPLIVTFTVTPSATVLLTEREQWDGPGVC